MEQPETNETCRNWRTLDHQCYCSHPSTFHMNMDRERSDTFKINEQAFRRKVLWSDETTGFADHSKTFGWVNQKQLSSMVVVASYCGALHKDEWKRRSTSRFSLKSIATVFNLDSCVFQQRSKPHQNWIRWTLSFWIRLLKGPNATRLTVFQLRFRASLSQNNNQFTQTSPVLPRRASNRNASEFLLATK